MKTYLYKYTECKECYITLLTKLYHTVRFRNDCIPLLFVSVCFYPVFIASNLDWLKLKLTSQLLRSLTATLAGLWDANTRNCDVDFKSFLFTWAGWPEAGSSAWLPHIHCEYALSALSRGSSGSRCQHTDTTQHQFPVTQHQCVLSTLNDPAGHQVLGEMGNRLVSKQLLAGTSAQT